MHDFATAYYHFSGSDDTFDDLGQNNLLMSEVMLWAKRQGFSRYHLGGGVSSSQEDSLLRFKSGFSGQRAILYTYGRIHHQSTYEYLCQLKRKHEIETMGTVIESDYLPLYRR